MLTPTRRRPEFGGPIDDIDDPKTGTRFDLL
jgi:hypothetical protein